MTRSVSAEEATSNIRHYLQRAASQHERFLVVQQGRPLAAVVSAEDFERLEALDHADREHQLVPGREAAFRRALEEAGLVVQWPTGPEVPLGDRVPLPIEGPPLSQQIIEERR